MTSKLAGPRCSHSAEYQESWLDRNGLTKTGGRTGQRVKQTIQALGMKE